MKRSKFSEAQIAFILRQAEEGTAVGEVCRKAGISEATYYYWRKKYAGLTPSEMSESTCKASCQLKLRVQGSAGTSCGPVCREYLRPWICCLRIRK